MFTPAGNRFPPPARDPKSLSSVSFSYGEYGRERLIKTKGKRRGKLRD
jgi:hypothetical protein